MSKYKIERFLKFIWDNLIARWIVGLLISAWPLKKLFTFFQDHICPTIQKTLNTIIEIPHQQFSISEILLLLILIFIFIISFKKVVKRFRQTYYFIKEGKGLKWKVNKRNGHVEFYPFCRKHGIELRESIKSTHFDPYYLYCVKDHYIKGYSEYEIKDLREKVTKIAKAKFHGHYNKV